MNLTFCHFLISWLWYIYILVSIFTFTYIYTDHLSPSSRGLSRLEVLIWNAWPRCLHRCQLSREKKSNNQRRKRTPRDHCFQPHYYCYCILDVLVLWLIIDTIRMPSQLIFLIVNAYLYVLYILQRRMRAKGCFLPYS